MVKKEKEEKEEKVTDPKNEILEATIAAMDKEYGKGSILWMSDSKFEKDIDVIETGSMMLNRALGIGGFPKGRIIELFGNPSSGKSTMALMTVANAQKNGDIALYVDSEHCLDKIWAKKLGVNLDKMLVSQPSHGEEALDIVENFVRSDTVGIIVVDSVSALIPRAELEGEFSDSQIGLQARLMSKAMRKLAAPVSESNTCLIFINQIRQNISTFGYGNPEVTSGGNALKFYASIRVELKQVKTLKEGQSNIGSLIRATVKKNKLAPPFGVCEIPLIGGIGFSQKDELIDELIRLNKVIKSGAWYSTVGGTKIGQGRESIKNYFDKNPQYYQDSLNFVKLSELDQAQNEE